MSAEEIVQEIKTLKEEMVTRAQETQQLQIEVQSLKQVQIEIQSINNALKEERINRAQSLPDGLKEEKANRIADIQKMKKDMEDQDDHSGKWSSNSFRERCQRLHARHLDRRT